MSDKIKRNDPCPCGSGKKFKACCWVKEQEKKQKRFSASKMVAKNPMAGLFANMHTEMEDLKRRVEKTKRKAEEQKAKQAEAAEEAPAQETPEAESE